MSTLELLRIAHTAIFTEDPISDEAYLFLQGVADSIAFNGGEYYETITEAYMEQYDLSREDAEAFAVAYKEALETAHQNKRHASG